MASNYTAECLDAGYILPFYMAETLLEEKIHVQKFLDCGSGTGILSASVKEFFPNAKATALDFSDKMLGRALSAGFADAVICHDILKTPWPVNGQMFDVAGAASLIDHIQNIPSLLAEMTRHVKAGGHIIFSHQETDITARHQSPDGYDVYLWSSADIERFIEDAGLTLIGMERVSAYQEVIVPIPANIILALKPE